MNARPLAPLLLLLGVLPATAWPAEKIPYRSCFETASRLHDVPMDLLLAVAATESGWDPDARSNANAHGIMQIQWPGTARHLGVRRISELYNPCLNIELGARYLRELLDANGGDEQRTLAAYNYGPTRIRASAELPAGAVRYAETVDAHRNRIGAQALPARSAPNPAHRVAFDSRSRAERFATTLNERITGARFVTSKDTDGRYVVAMELEPDGLTVSDHSLLDALGWSTLGAGK